MPFLRFSRDRRGYESTYLCHTHRRGGTPRLRVLYWFRSPPDVKVGRLALDPEAIRAIEESNPDLQFDWSRILKVKPPPPDRDRGGPEGRRGRRNRGRDSSAASIPPPGGPISQVEPIETADPAQAESEELGGAGPAARRPEPASAGWSDADPAPDGDAPELGPPAHVVLGLTDEQGLARLRARHAEIQARIGDRFRDPATLEKVLAQASLLDPDAWRSAEEARERLGALEENLAAIRKVLGRRRRTRRGRPRRRRPRETGTGEASGAAGAGVAGAGSAADDPET